MKKYFGYSVADFCKRSRCESAHFSGRLISEAHVVLERPHDKSWEWHGLGTYYTPSYNLATGERFLVTGLHSAARLLRLSTSFITFVYKLSSYDICMFDSDIDDVMFFYWCFWRWIVLQRYRNEKRNLWWLGSWKEVLDTASHIIPLW